MNYLWRGLVKFLILTIFVLSGFFVFTNRVLAADYFTALPAECPSWYNPNENLVQDEIFWYDGEHFRFSFTVDKTFCTGWSRRYYSLYDISSILSPLSVAGESRSDDPSFKFINNVDALTGFLMGESRFFIWQDGQRYNAYLSNNSVSTGGYLYTRNLFEYYISIGWTEERFSNEVTMFTYNYDSIWHRNRNLKAFKIDFDYFLEPEKLDPVIIIPGILGSWKVKGEWKIDPILGTYNNLIEAFIDAGYKTETIFNNDPNLFVFPYDWRVDNNITANLLKDKIQEVKTLTGSNKVDIVAHSMGGLVTRSYIQSNDYNNDIDQLIMLGTPHLGSPESYKKLNSYFGDGVRDKISNIIFQIEAIRNGYFDLTKYIQEQVPTISQLLPIFGYLKDRDLNSNWQIRYYPDNYPRNVFLENLNRSDQLGLLKQRVDITNIISGQGSASASSTLRYIKVVPDSNTTDNKWQYGYPINLDQSEEAFEAGNGDGTVPYESANYLNGVKTISLSNNSHNDLPTVMQQYIIEILTGKKPTAYFEAASAYNISRWSMFRVYSPVDFMVIAPDGKRVGKDFVNNTEINEIDGAFYTGFDDHTEFVMIPNPQDGEYRVELQGVDNGGEYTLVSSFIDENNPQLNKDLEVKSTIASGTIDGFKINYNYNNPDITNVESEVDFPKLIDLVNYFYSNNQISKKAAYNFLVDNLKELSHKYDKILTKESKHDLEDDDHEYITKKRDNYYERELNKHHNYDDKKKENNKYHGIKKQLKHMIEKIEFYYDKNWITIQVKNVLISNINLLIKKL